MLDLQHLRTFCAVIATKNFTRAAKDLGCSQSTVTTHIVALERELGAPLFERQRFSKVVVLTDAGRRALGYAQKLLELAQEAQAAVRSIEMAPG